MGDFCRCTVILLLFLLILPACSPFSSKKPPVILVLVEALSEQDYLCSDPRLFEGLDDLNAECDQFVRFTHTFAPSPMTQPALATVMTGKEVSEHKVETNGAEGLSYQYQTIAELALNNRMKTAFFSGGVPLMQKFGLSQGFEFFNDSFDQKGDLFFRPFEASIERSLKWLDEEVQGRPFFMVFYVPDMLFKDYVTTSNLDDERPISRTSQLQEVYESFDLIIKELKRRRKWENSHVIFMGIGGPHEGLHLGNPLSSDFLHVPLQIKPAKGLESNLADLTGELISFARIGEWLEKLVGHKPAQGKIEFNSRPEGSFLPQQSHLSMWLNLSTWPELGLRKKRYLFSLSPDLDVYDSFVDKKEMEPLPPAEARNLVEKYEIDSKFKSFFSDDCFRTSAVGPANYCVEYSQNRRGLSDLLQLMQWSDRRLGEDNNGDEIEDMIQKALKENSPELIAWLAYKALYLKKWTSLFELGKHTQNQAWMTVAQANLREETPGAKGCLRYFVGENHNIENFYKFCEDTGLRKVVEGLKRLKEKKRPSDSFWAQVHNIRSVRRAKKINLEMQFVNDIDQAFDYSPKLAELYFFLPENSKYQHLIDTDKS